MQTKFGTSVHTKLTIPREQTAHVTFTLNLSMNLLTPLLVFDVSRLNRNRHIFDSVSVEYIDDSAYEIIVCPESFFFNVMWDCCFIQLFHMENRPTIKGQQREYSHKRRTAACSAGSGTEVV